ncbi:BTAD domain-containing putative transcriptional regulator [Marasmitruncus massiliensis]|uniref:BTAD domain-containing putative transcriptional regulator n=1 Tax=Marasmitruncus massiliensis TaxID=1944642 RepID=UPI0011AEE265|nr:BTAD domain-containing putative transcriptional regulator [Marasmitruncus massiliensis]
MTVFANPTTGHKIYVQMLGGFQLVADGKVLSDSISRTRQLRNLLAYLLAFRKKAISQETLIDVLWPDGCSGSPANALKNLVYRMRTIFGTHEIPYAKELVVFHQGSYCWNNNLNTEIDIEKFEQLKKLADDTSLPDENRVDCYLEAISLYKGDFLPASCYEEWVVSLVNYYRTEYFKCVYEASALLVKLERYETVQTICEQAIVIDPLEEGAHRYLIFSLVRQNKQQKALEHYRYVRDLFYRELGVKPSDTMRELYNEITKSVQTVETDLDIIKGDLNEQNAAEGAFYCDYEIFKNMYRLEVRAASRTGHSVFLCLLTVTDRRGSLPGKEQLSGVMSELLETIRSSLRKGDVISKFSPSQFVLMLPMLTYENGEMVMGRICDRFYEKTRFRGIKLSADLRPLDAAI